ncbi:sigma factor [Aeromicrobium duanguangcaii]|uniref:sigma factor n=1 Tax=Aeromicrobium duanguangcaii TaxID=2968086 RepID=UPI00384CD084
MSPFVSHALAQAPLPPDAERLLARAAAGGDRDAREELICAGLRNVALHALRLGHRGDDLDEAVAAGVEGLIRAVDRFDPDRGTRLATYAWAWIARAMTPAPTVVVSEPVLRVRADGDLLSELPVELAAVVGLRFGLLCEDGVGLTIQEVADRLRLTRWQVRDREGRGLSRLREGLARVSHRAPLEEPIPRSSIGRAFDC